jgi:hypothetical protein
MLLAWGNPLERRRNAGGGRGDWKSGTVFTGVEDEFDGYVIKYGSRYVSARISHVDNLRSQPCKHNSTEIGGLIRSRLINATHFRDLSGNIVSYEGCTRKAHPLSFLGDISIWNNWMHTIKRSKV